MLQEYWVNASAAGSIFSLPHAADGGAKQQGNMVQAVMRTLPLSMPSLGKEDRGTLRYPIQPPGPLAKLLFQAFKDLGEHRVSTDIGSLPTFQPARGRTWLLGMQVMYRAWDIDISLF